MSTAAEPSISFFYKSNKSLDNCLCLLVVRDSEKKFTYNWRRIGKVAPGKEYRTKFGLEDDFFDLDDLAIYFFDKGKEVLTGGRRQLQYFTQPTLKDFTAERNRRIKTLAEGSFDPSPYKPIDSYLYGFAGSNAGTEVVFHISKLGFVKDLTIKNAKSKEIKSKLLYQLSKVTLLPRIENGELRSSRVSTKLK